jgi:hypothetical protein
VAAVLLKICVSLKTKPNNRMSFCNHRHIGIYLAKAVEKKCN